MAEYDVVFGDDPYNLSDMGRLIVPDHYVEMFRRMVFMREIDLIPAVPLNTKINKSIDYLTLVPREPRKVYHISFR